MKVVYLAGPYRNDTEYGVHRNIQQAESLAIEVWRLGAVCLCPQKNTAYFGGALPDSVWLDGDLELIRRSDAVLLMPSWESSDGAMREKAFAEQLGLPVCRTIDELRKWMSSDG